MARILITRKVFPQALSLLESAGHELEINDTQRILPTEELVERCQGKDGLVCLLTDRIDAAVMDALPNLKVISTVAVGYDNIDIPAATDRGILVTHTPGVLTETTADMAFALMLGAARRLAEADAYVREQRFEQWDLVQELMGMDVHGKTLGIVGMGRIGRALAERAHLGFNMRILYYSRSRNEEAERTLRARFVSFQELLTQSDFISIHVPLAADTTHLFSREQFRAMKNSAILINTARGPIVDETALAAALEDKEIAGAGLDVFEEEPRVHPSLLQLKESVVLAPHVGSASLETRLGMAMMAAENMVEALKGELPPNPVNPEARSTKQE